MRKLLSALLAMVLVFSLFPVTAFAFGTTPSAKPLAANPAAGIPKTGTYVTDEYDDDKYNSSVTINADRTFSMNINFGMGFIPIAGTWETSQMDDGTTVIAFNVQKDFRHEGWKVSDNYYLEVSPHNNNHLYIPNGASTMGVLPEETLFIYRGA